MSKRNPYFKDYEEIWRAKANIHVPYIESTIKIGPPEDSHSCQSSNNDSSKESFDSTTSNRLESIPPSVEVTECKYLY